MLYTPRTLPSYLLTLSILLLSLLILILTSLLASWTNQSPPSYPHLPIKGTTPPTTIPAFPSNYSSYGLILTIVPAVGGTIDAFLLLICLLSIEHIYHSRAAHKAYLSKAAAREGRAPTWLWGVTLFIVCFSIGRSFVGFVVGTVGYYSSGWFEVGSDGSVAVDGEGRYVDRDGRGFSVGAWTCQVAGYVDGGDPYRGRLRGLCAMDGAARWLVFILMILYGVLLGVLLQRYREAKYRRSRGMTLEAGKE